MRPPRALVDRRPRFGLARALSKLGYCSRTQAQRLIAAGRVSLNGRNPRDPETPVALGRDRIEVDGRPIEGAEKVYLMLNKPRGLVTTTTDEKGRGTVYRCLDGAGLPWVSPVGRLDKASEGLLLFSNDTAWSARLLDPASHLDKLYHVQIDRLADEPLLEQLRAGVPCEGELLRAKSVRLLRRGSRNSWLEVVLDEGRNRQIRRLLAGLEVGVLRLLRVAIGPVQLGELPKGQYRLLTEAERRALEG